MVLGIQLSCVIVNKIVHKNTTKFRLRSRFCPIFVSMWNQTKFESQLHLCILYFYSDIGEICSVSFIICYCTFWFDVIIAPLIFDLGATELFISISLFEYFAVVWFCSNVMCIHVLLLHLIWTFLTYDGNFTLFFWKTFFFSNFFSTNLLFQLFFL